MATGKRKKAAPEVAKKIETTAPVVYVGPTIHDIGAIANTIYSDVPASVEKAFEEKPILRMLFVQLDKYPAAEREIRERSGAYWSAFMAAVSYQAELKRR